MHAKGSINEFLCLWLKNIGVLTVCWECHACIYAFVMCTYVLCHIPSYIYVAMIILCSNYEIQSLFLCYPTKEILSKTPTAAKATQGLNWLHLKNKSLCYLRCGYFFTPHHVSKNKVHWEYLVHIWIVIVISSMNTLIWHPHPLYLHGLLWYW